MRRRGETQGLTPPITLNDVPIDVFDERLSTMRGALYKTLHDAANDFGGDMPA